MSVINDNVHVDGNLSCLTFTVANNGIPSVCVVHEFPVWLSQKDGIDVADLIQAVHVARKNGTLVDFEVVPIVAPTGGNKAYTVDLQKGNQAGAFATVLSAPVTVDNSKANRQVLTATLSSTSYSDGDTLRIHFATSGTTGSQGQGVIATLRVRENPT